MEFLCLFHLETADFSNHPVFFCQAFHFFTVRDTDVTNHSRIAVNSFHDFACQCCCCCFTICACDGSDGAFCQAISQFHFTDDRNACRFCRIDKGQITGDAGAQNDDVLFAGNIVRVCTCVKHDPLIFQIQHICSNIFSFLHILQCHFCAQAFQ